MHLKEEYAYMKKKKHIVKRILTMVPTAIMILMALPLAALAAGEETTEPEMPAYTIRIGKTEGGSVSFMKDGEKVVFAEDEEMNLAFHEGDKVTLKAKAADGYEYAGCKAVSLNLDLEKEFRPEDEIVFEMPASDVEILASFEKLPELMEEIPAETPEETVAPAEETAAQAESEPAFDPEIIESLSKETYVEKTITLQEFKVSDKKDGAETRAIGDVYDFWSDPNWGEGDVLYYGNINGTTTPAYCIDHSYDRPQSYYTQISPVFLQTSLAMS